MLTEQDKKAVNYLLSLTFQKLEFLNLEFIYSQVDEMFQSPDFSNYIYFLEKKNNCEDKDEFKNYLLQIFMCHLYVQNDLIEHKKVLLKEIREWLLSSYTEEDTNDIVDRYYRRQPGEV